MSSGIMRVLRDSAADFAAWRKQTFGFELAPLPRATWFTSENPIGSVVLKVNI
jgi:hypothetical protein